MSFPDVEGDPGSGRRITRIEPSPRPQGARAVFVDGALFCVVPAGTICGIRLEVGARVTPEQLNHLEAAANRASALEAAFRLLAYRPRSRVELERRLRRSNHSHGAIQAALTRCDELGYLDDQSFALSFVRDR